MFFRKSALTIILLSFPLTLLFAQKSYKISLQIDGLNDSILLLASYNGDKQFVADTAYKNRGSGYSFTGIRLLPEGMYFVAGSNKTKLFDFIISGKQEFTITGKNESLPGSLNAKNSNENQTFFNYVRFLADKQKQQVKLVELKKRLTTNSDSAEVVDNQISLLNEEVKRYVAGIINTNPGSFISAFLKSMQEPEIPPVPVLSNGRPDSTFNFRYYKAHFWDNTDLADDRMVRTPFLHNKVEQYLSKLTSPAPDSLIAAIDGLFRRAGNNEETFKYLMWYFTIKYESSDIMGYDAIFVHLVDTYYADPKMKWMNLTVKENLIKRAKTLRPLLIGKNAPELILLDTLQRPVSLYKIPSEFTIIYFWDPDCSHCKKETPLLRDFYAKNKTIFDFEVYAVCMDTSWKDMKKYIIKNETRWINVNGFYSLTNDFRDLYDVHSSPVMYLLDRNKKIIAKRILTERMAEILAVKSQKESIKQELH
ncbi:MAG: thioredoxin-like domain-containing protein [Bacteroidota bacterium]